MPSARSQASRISLEEFTEVTLNSVIRAMDARSRPNRKFPFGPIIFGIIWYPEGMNGPLGDVGQPNIGKVAGR